jgi:hypothetical protein
MSMSAFFRALHDAYQSEIEDLSHDSEGRDVLKQRLLEKRSQLPFLLQMMEISPEMVAAVFHGGFHFELPAVMEQLLTLESDELPDWGSLHDAVHVTPWAKDLAEAFLKESQGAWFLTVAATLEYLYQRPTTPHHVGLARHQQEQHDHGGGRTARSRDIDHGHDYDHDEAHDQDHDHEEASQDWLEGQGFDRKD